MLGRIRILVTCYFSILISHGKLVAYYRNQVVTNDTLQSRHWYKVQQTLGVTTASVPHLISAQDYFLLQVGKKTC